MTTKTIKLYILLLCPLALLFLSSCDPEAKWTTKNVTIGINPRIVSAGHIECEFAPDKDAYYLVACVPAREGYDPTAPENQKQFMTLALDSANQEYIHWRDWRLQNGEFNVAPFSSHSLNYGTVELSFTNLRLKTDYWIYAFVVNPKTLEPAGKLFLITVTTAETSVEDVHFDYRVRGYWDYVYPINPDGKINSHFPYLAATRDSIYLATEWNNITPEEYFAQLFLNYAEYNATDQIRYGIHVENHDGVDSDFWFEEGHTYYTAIVSFDGFIGNNVIYKFTWTGEDYDEYFTDEDSYFSDWEDE